MRRGVLAVAICALIAASVSGAEEQSAPPLSVRIPQPVFGSPATGPLAVQRLRAAAPLGPDAPTWARRLYRRSLRVLFALSDPKTGAMIAGDRPGWDHVWPRDAAAGAVALRAAGLEAEARRAAGFLTSLDLDRGARFRPDGEPILGRSPAGDAEGWVAAAVDIRGYHPIAPDIHPDSWHGSQDYGENSTGDLLGNAIAAGVPAPEIERRFLAPRGLVREQGADQLDSSAAWAVTVFPQPRLRGAAARTLLAFVRKSTPYGIPPIEGWTPGEVWTAPTAWSAWALVRLGNIRAADRLLAELHRAEAPVGTLPERVDAATGAPTSTTPLAWSHAFAILALRARYPSG